MSLWIVAGCSEETVEVTAKVKSISRAGYVIEIKSKPGLEATVFAPETTVKLDDQGLATLTLKPERFVGNNSNLNIDVDGGGLFTKYSGSVELLLPMQPRDLLKLPATSHWVRVMQGPVEGSLSGLHWTFKKAGQATVSTDGTLSMSVLAPPRATIEMLGKKVSTDDIGKGHLRLSSDEVIALLDSRKVSTGEDQVGPVSVKVTLADGASKKLELHGGWQGGGKLTFVRKWLEALRTKPLGGQRSAEPLLLYVDSKDVFFSTGRSGSVKTVDVVALAVKTEKRPMSPCGGYRRMGRETGPTFSVDRNGFDVDVVVFDAHSGKELGRRLFRAPEACPAGGSISRYTQHAFEAKPEVKDILAWALQQATEHA